MMILALGCLIGTSDSMCLKWIHFSGKTALLLSTPRFRKWQNHPPSCSSPGVVFDFFLTPHTITHHVLLILPLKMPLNLPTSISTATILLWATIIYLLKNCSSLLAGLIPIPFFPPLPQIPFLPCVFSLAPETSLKMHCDPWFPVAFWKITNVVISCLSFFL